VSTYTVKAGGRRVAIGHWRVKAGNREVYAGATRNDCAIWIRAQGGKCNGKKLRLIAPNI
jgi:hypothetical protein